MFKGLLCVIYTVLYINPIALKLEKKLKTTTCRPEREVMSKMWSVSSRELDGAVTGNRYADVTAQKTNRF